jgi:glutathione peroxidase-family protein
MLIAPRLCQTTLRSSFAQNLSSAATRHTAHLTTITTRKMSSATSFYDFTTKDDKEAPFPLAKYKGKVVLVVNTASKCGFTPQLDDLEALYKGMRTPYITSQTSLPTKTLTSLPSLTDIKATHPKDFEILAFPCNQFGGQDPGSNEEIQNFCVLGHKVTYKVLGKVEVNGKTSAPEEPVWAWMKNEKPGFMGLQRIKWNFEKFLIGKDGKVKGRWASTTKPASLKSAIEAEFK